ncbi:MAG TPA: endo-1,4-beta-xylanase [Terriglobia bacterium]|nr:endo-1,4-beta-xylanase [Terriglobia bacterium]
MNKERAMLTRRRFLATAAAFAGLSSRGLSALSASSMTLRESAAQKGIVYGSALRGMGLKDPSFADLFVRECGIAVPEGALKWGTLRPTPDTYDFGGGDWLLSFASQHAMKFRGHTLIWDGDLPAWFNSYINADNAAAMTATHISNVVRHYAGRVTSWDVVNEGIQIQDGQPDGLKMNPWLRFIGPDYIGMAFRVAHAADPQATLVYNENWLEPEDSTTEQRRRATLALLTKLKNKGVPVHALGVQSHVFAETCTTGPRFKHFLDEVSDLGLEIMVTEMDVRDQNLRGGPAECQRLVAEQYYRYLSFMLQFKSVKTVLTWGLSDRYTWINKHNPRADGLPTRPLPYDDNLQPTLAWYAIHKAFEEAGQR